MVDNFRRFDVGPDPFGRSWTVEFRWLQNGISIRHADTIDVKFQLLSGETAREQVIAIPHPDLIALSRKSGRAITDPWCMKLAATHIRRMIETDTDMEKMIVTLTLDDLERHNEILERPAPVRR